MNPILDALGGPIVQLGTTIIDRIFPDKVKQAEDRERAQLALLQAQQAGDLEAVKQQLSAIIAEASSNDPWTSRARPSFLYVIYVMILAGIPMGVVSAFRPDIAAAIAQGMGMWLKAIPDSLWQLFGVGYLGYAAARTVDKIKGAA